MLAGNMACDQWDPRSEMWASVQSDLDHLLPADEVLKIIETRSAKPLLSVTT